MTRKNTFVLLFFVFAILGLTVETVMAYRLNVYTNPGGDGTEDAKPPYYGGNGWTSAGTVCPVTVPGNGSLYVACRNWYVSINQKNFKLIISGVGINNLAPRFEGFKTSGTSSQSKRRVIRVRSSANKKKYVVRFTPQPHWERVKLTNMTSIPVSITIKAKSRCSRIRRSIWGLIINPFYFNAIDAVSEPSEITEMYFFPLSVPIDMTIAPTFLAHNGGTWSYEYVFTDPDGEPRPLGGIRFYTLTYGLDTAEEFESSFSMTSDADIMYDVYSYDAAGDETELHTHDVSHTPECFTDPTYGDGDVNRDGVVDNLDIDIANNNFGMPDATWSDGDMDGDLDVDQDDINIINQNMGRTY